MNLTKLKSLYTKHNHLLLPLALVVGFVLDIVTFASLSFDLTILTLVIHLILAGLSIVVINFYEEGVIPKLVDGRISGYARLIAPLVLQFSFGALFSSFIIFYSYSGSIFASWPFLLAIVFLMLANEIFSKYNTRPDIQLSVYFFALFSFLNLAIPYLVRGLGPVIFILSAILSVFLAGLFVWFLAINLERVAKVIRAIIGSVGIIFIVMNVLYFTNFIPPIPLALGEAGVYYQVERVGSGYRLIGGEKGFFDRLVFWSDRFPIYGASEAYIFTSIFIPPGMALGAVHEWQFYDERTGWVTRNTVSFQAAGGRAHGFRAYSKTANVVPGKWRVNIRTDRGQVIGRYYFVAFAADKPPKYILETR
jgi:hypothetical protein